MPLATIITRVACERVYTEYRQHIFLTATISDSHVSQLPLTQKPRGFYCWQYGLNAVRTKVSTECRLVALINDNEHSQFGYMQQ